jgi:dCMP deaminase
MRSQYFWDERFLRLAEHISRWAKDPSTKVGAVIVDEDRRIVSLGYNGLPKGVADTHERLHNRELKYKTIIHGERNAILFAERSVRHCTLYTWPFQPCSVCASMVIQVGISRVVSLNDANPRWVSDFALSSELFAEAGVQLDHYDLQPVVEPEIIMAPVLPRMTRRYLLNPGNWLRIAKYIHARP